MADEGAVAAASKRLSLALEALEAAVERRREADHDQAGMAAQVHALDNDRSRLASELDLTAARARALQESNRAAVQRIDAAVEVIREVIAGRDEAGG